MNMKEEMVFYLKVFISVVVVATADSAQDLTKTVKDSSTSYGYPPLVYTYSVHPTITTYSNGQVETSYGDVSHQVFSANQNCPNCQNSVPEVRIGAHTKYSRLKAGKSLQPPSQQTNYVPVTKEKSNAFSNVPVFPVKPDKILPDPANDVDSTITFTPSRDASFSTTADVYKNLGQTSFASYQSNQNPIIDSRFSENVRNTAQTRTGYPVSKFTITYVPVSSNPLKYDNNKQFINSNKDVLGSAEPSYYYNVETIKSDGNYYLRPQVFSNPSFLRNTAIPFFQNSYVTPTTDTNASKNAYTQSTTSIYPSMSILDSKISTRSLLKGENIETSTPATGDSFVASTKSTEYVSPSQSIFSSSSAPDVSRVNYNSRQVSYNW